MLNMALATISAVKMLVTPPWRFVMHAHT